MKLFMASKDNLEDLYQLIVWLMARSILYTKEMTQVRIFKHKIDEIKQNQVVNLLDKIRNCYKMIKNQPILLIFGI